MRTLRDRDYIVRQPAKLSRRILMDPTAPRWTMVCLYCDTFQTRAPSENYLVGLVNIRRHLHAKHRAEVAKANAPWQTWAEYNSAPVAAHIERCFKHVDVSSPGRGTGVDLLLTDRRHRRAVGLQVKLSNYVQFGRPEYEKRLRACGYWNIDRNKLHDSPADYWVLLLQGLAARSEDYVVVVPPAELWRRLQNRWPGGHRVHVFLWVTKDERCWDTLELSKDNVDRIFSSEYDEPEREYTEWLNNWKPIARLNR